MYPYSNVSLLSRSFEFIKNIKWGAILDGTGKTLGVINQAIPVIYQVKPLFSNAKTLFKIANVINEPKNTNNTDIVNTTSTRTNNNSPIFYI